MVKQSRSRGGPVPPGVELRKIPELSNKYIAGSDGHIYCFSKAAVNAGKPQPFLLTEAIGSAGYPFVAIIEKDRRRTIPVHRLVCAAFHGEKPSKSSVTRHLDGNKINNAPLNLAWGSYAQNEADKRRHGQVAEGERHGYAKLTEESVKIIRASIPFGLWNTADAAKVFGVDIATIRSIARGKGWKHVK